MAVNERPLSQDYSAQHR